MLVPIPLLQSYLDDSADEKREDIFCIGGILAHEQNLKPMQEAWIERLRVPDDIPYFRASACKGAHEPFFKLREKYGSGAQAVANKIRSDLEAILLSHTWLGFGLGIVVPDYKEIWNSVPVAKTLYREDPVEAAFSQMFFQIAYATQANAEDYQVAFVIDDSTHSGKIAEAFKALKVTNPSIAGHIATLVPLDDKMTPPLQMADLVASLVKDIFLEWIANEKSEKVSLELKWHNHFEIIGKWDKRHMLKNIEATLNDPRYKAGELPARSVPEPTNQYLKRIEKKRRKEMARLAGLRK